MKSDTEDSNSQLLQCFFLKRYKCPNLSSIAAMPNSTLYSCKSCNTPLKLWPVECLAVSQCAKCEEKIENNGRNLHVCFTCPKTHVSHRQHLCSDHGDVHLQRVVLVDFIGIGLIKTDEFLPSVADNVEEGVGEEVLTRQPSWQQKISSTIRVVENKPIQMARQTSMKLKRMTSTSSTSQRMDGLDEVHHLLPLRRVTVQLVDDQLFDTEVPPAEVTLTSFDKLLSDLTFYAGVPEIQGILVRTESDSFVQVFDMERIPEGNLKIQVVKSGEKQYLRLHSGPQIKEE